MGHGALALLQQADFLLDAVLHNKAMAGIHPLRLTDAMSPLNHYFSTTAYPAQLIAFQDRCATG